MSCAPHWREAQRSNCTLERPPFGTRRESDLRDIGDLGKKVWSFDGVNVLGSPIRTQQFIQFSIFWRLEEERKLWKAIALVTVLQCAWQLLLQCAGPGSYHVLRTAPPSQSARYPAGHDESMFQTMTALLGSHQAAENRLPQLSAARTGPGAYWASWVDVLPMLHDRLPIATVDMLAQLKG